MGFIFLLPVIIGFYLKLFKSFNLFFYYQVNVDMLRICVTFLSATTLLIKHFFAKNHTLVDFTFVCMQQVGRTNLEHVDATVASTKEPAYKWKRRESERLTIKGNQSVKCTLNERKG